MTTSAVSGLTVTLTAEGIALGAAKNYTLTINQATIDTTSDDSSRWGEYIVGRREWTIDIDCLYIYTDVAQKIFEEHITAEDPAEIDIVLTMPDGRTYTGVCIVTSITYTSNFEDVITASVSLQGTDALATTTS